MARRGRPGLIVSDHGTEFTSNALLEWRQASGIAWHFIAPGKPMQNGICEAFNARNLAGEPVLRLPPIGLLTPASTGT
jgi:putative transposase